VLTAVLIASLLLPCAPAFAQDLARVEGRGFVLFQTVKPETLVVRSPPPSCFEKPISADLFGKDTLQTLGNSRVRNVALEFIGGVALGIGGGIAGALVGQEVRGNPGWECPDCPGNVGAGEGFALGAAFGSATAVYAIGTALGDNGTFTASLIGGALPAALGIVIAEVGRDPHGGYISALFGFLAPLGATIGFNVSERDSEVPNAPISVVVGSAIKSYRWQDVPLDRLHVSLVPQRDEFAVGMRVAF
jgi:hypothetical protein